MPIAMLTLELHAIPESREAHELPVFALGKVWQLFFTVVLLEPFVEALRDYDAALLLLHGRPHTAIFHQ